MIGRERGVEFIYRTVRHRDMRDGSNGRKGWGDMGLEGDENGMV